MRSWRNWQTHKTKDLVAFKAVEVQVLLTAPKENEKTFARCNLAGVDLFFFCVALVRKQ